MADRELILMILMPEHQPLLLHYWKHWSWMGLKPITPTRLPEKDGVPLFGHLTAPWGHASRFIPAGTHHGRVAHAWEMKRAGARSTWSCSPWVAETQEHNSNHLQMYKYNSFEPPRCWERQINQPRFCRNISALNSFLWVFGYVIISDWNHTNHCSNGWVLHANHNPNVH